MLKLDGKPFTTKVITPAVGKVRDFLLKAPPDEIYSSKEMFSRGFSKDSLAKMHPEFPELTRTWQAKRYYGSPKAMATFDKEVNQ